MSLKSILDSLMSDHNRQIPLHGILFIPLFTDSFTTVDFLFKKTCFLVCFSDYFRNVYPYI